MAMAFADYVLGTMDRLPVNGEYGLYQPLHDWVAVNKLWATNKLGEATGKDHLVYMTKSVGSTTVFGDVGDVRNPTIADHLVKCTLPMINCWFDVSYTENEVDKNMGAHRIVNVIKARREANILGFYTDQETYLWAMPATTGNKKPYGIPYHLPPILTGQVAGSGGGAFQGANPIGFSDDLGADLATTANQYLRTYNAVWPTATATTITIDQATKTRLANMMMKLHFRAPNGVTGATTDAANYLMAAPLTVINALGVAAQQQNDNLGNDVTRFMNLNIGGNINTTGVVINGLPVSWVETLDTADATNRGYLPMYMVNLNQFKTIVNTNKFMLHRPVFRPQQQPDVFVEYIDCEFNYGPTARSHKRSLGGVISYVA